jgi:hypothetical protein
MVRLAQQQLSASAACEDSWMPLIHLLKFVQHLLCCWRKMIQQGPAHL